MRREAAVAAGDQFRRLADLLQGHASLFGSPFEGELRVESHENLLEIFETEASVHGAAAELVEQLGRGACGIGISQLLIQA